VGLLAGAFAPRSADAQPDTTRWTPALTMQYDQIADTEISPDGEHVAYVVREAVMEATTSAFRQHIHVAAVDGSFDLQYTRGEHSNFGPKWSPSGDRLAFLSTRGGRPQVYVMRLRGGEAYPITSAQTGVQGFQWGPDGERIAYRMTDPKSKAERQREKAKRDVNVVNEEFRYAHLNTTEVKPASDTTRTVQRLTDGDFHVTGFDWAPDGDTIAFAHKPNPRINSSMELDISVVPADSGATEVLVERPGMDMNPHYSPGGERIALESMGGTEAWESLSDIWTVPAEGGEPSALAQTPDRNVGGYGPGIVGWTAGGASVLVLEHAKTSTHLYEVSANGRSVSQVTSRKGVYGSPSYSRSAGRLAFVYENSESPPEVYVSGWEDVSRQKITNVNSDKPTPRWAGPNGWRGPRRTGQRSRACSPTPSGTRAAGFPSS
jgi:Tol biopolymer transport system component